MEKSGKSQLSMSWRNIVHKRKIYLKQYGLNSFRNTSFHTLRIYPTFIPLIQTICNALFSNHRSVLFNLDYSLKFLPMQLAYRFSFLRIQNLEKSQMSQGNKSVCKYLLNYSKPPMMVSEIVILCFFFSCKAPIFVQHFTFCHFYSVISWNNCIEYLTKSFQYANDDYI